MTLLRYSPDELLERFRALRTNIDTRAFFSSPKHKKLQEMWCAAHFGRGLESSGTECAIEIADKDLQTDVDFELEVRRIKHQFQITEVQSPNRRRGDEYKGISDGPWSDDDWTLGEQHGAEWIRQAVGKKVNQYGSVANLHLLVYVNFPAWGQDYDALRKHIEPTGSSFCSVWLLNGNSTCCVKECTTLPAFDGWLLISESLAAGEA